MSIKTTYYIERDVAIQVLQSKINSLSNEELGNMLDKLSEFRNFLVYDSLPDDESWFNIKSVSDF